MAATNENRLAKLEQAQESSHGGLEDREALLESIYWLVVWDTLTIADWQREHGKPRDPRLHHRRQAGMGR